MNQRLNHTKQLSLWITQRVQKGGQRSWSITGSLKLRLEMEYFLESTGLSCWLTAKFLSSRRVVWGDPGLSWWADPPSSAQQPHYWKWISASWEQACHPTWHLVSCRMLRLGGLWGILKNKQMAEVPLLLERAWRRSEGSWHYPCVVALRTTLENFHTLHSSHTGETSIIQNQSDTFEFSIINSINTMKKPMHFRKDYSIVAESQI